jgi:hypothetical protein
VLILRAPYDVRQAIEEWVGQEVSCWTSLEIRVVPTEGGLYLLGREPNGRLHERLVPDAQSAGVLVASWIANDAVAPVLAPAPAPLPEGPPPRRPASHIAPLVSPDIVKPPPHIMPLISPVIQPLDASDVAPSRMRYGGRWLSVGVSALLNGTSGARLRGELDLRRRGDVALGMIVSADNTSRDIYGDMTADVVQLQRLDLRALVGLSWTVLAHRLRLRMQLAAGGVWSHEFGYTAPMSPEDSLTAAIEASVTLSYELSDGLELGVTPQAIWYASDWLPYELPPDEGAGVLLELRRRL